MKNFTCLFSLLVCAFAFGQSTANYNIEFESFWNATDHGTLPSNPHWSPLVGANHKSSITYFEMGGIATQGIENIAETGNITEFRNNEVNPSITNGNAEQFINGGGLGSATGKINIDGLEVNEDFPLLTLVSMIAPSPDWIIGINGINLRNASNTDWKSLIEIDLYIYDAGTDSGTNYSDTDADITPHIPINSLKGIAPFNNTRIGTFKITLQSVLGVNNLTKFSNTKIYPNPTNGLATISNIKNNELNTIEIFNILGRLVKEIPVKQGLTKIDMDLTSLNKGVYLVNLKAFDGASKTQKLVIK
ncbi:hypothetical protein GCM10023311_23500 [Flaviramulus aquimarinus]|uniref:Spondin domain-containing protein n=1 Tax=Flaviramulus aquimarinus TaxID=1170456 RepID=A0ABP9FKA7_9FLAO